MFMNPPRRHDLLHCSFCLPITARQGIIITGLDSKGLIHKSVQFSDKVIADGLQVCNFASECMQQARITWSNLSELCQDFIICVEMAGTH